MLRVTTPNVSGAFWTSALTQTAVQTSNYTASPNQIVPVSTASGNVTVTLPQGAPSGSIVVVKMVTLSGSNTVTVSAVSGDVFNKAGGGTTATLQLLNQGIILEYQTGIWVVLADDLPLSQLDARYDQQSVLTTLGDMLYENSTPAPARLPGNTSATKNYLTQTGTGTASAEPAWGTIAAGDLPTGTTSAQGALQLDGTATDIQPTGIQAAGASGLAADAKHVHFCSGSYLCPPTSYAPAGGVALATSSSTMAALNVAPTTVASGSNGGEISQIASWSSPSAGVLDVTTTTGWPTSGTVNVAASGATTAVVTYAGTAAGQLTGCAYVSGSATGTVSTGGAVTLTSVSINTGSFTAPPSGKVMVTVSLIDSQSGNNTSFYGLAAHGTVTPVIGNVFSWSEPSGALRPRILKFLVTGLTNGTSYDFDLLFAASSGTTTVEALGQSSTTPSGNGAPVTMEVQSV